jgi:uncharacterized protein YndB with AHSA1/START domain
MTTSSEVAVRRSVTVPLVPERAFRLFAGRMSSWWPPEHHIGDAELADVVIESHNGGRWYEVGTDGSQCQWGMVKRWDPPGRLVLVWQLSADWRYDPALETEVEVRFIAVGGETRVELEHRGLDRYGEAAERMRLLFEGPAAWQGTLDRYAASSHLDR